MALRLGALQDALLDPGNPEKALKAAEELAGYENRLGTIEARLTSIEQRLTILTWVIGLIFAVELSIVALVFQILGRLPR